MAMDSTPLSVSHSCTDGNPGRSSSNVQGEALDSRKYGNDEKAPGLFKLLQEDIACVFQRDPAARSTFEVLTTYPGVHAILPSAWRIGYGRKPAALSRRACCPG
jgi:hypothetical protein